MSVYFINDDEHLSQFIENPDLPNVCPVCNYNVIPDCLLVSDKDFEDGIAGREVVFKCSNTNCNSLFIVHYKCYGRQFSEVFATTPNSLRKIDVSKEIKSI